MSCPAIFASCCIYFHRHIPPSTNWAWISGPSNCDQHEVVEECHYLWVTCGKVGNDETFFSGLGYLRLGFSSWFSFVASAGIIYVFCTFQQGTGGALIFFANLDEREIDFESDTAQIILRPSAGIINFTLTIWSSVPGPYHQVAYDRPMTPKTSCLNQRSPRKVKFRVN